MANDSLIRKIDLHGNVDLTNFHADIHDYEGFEKDNSLFLNKRKVNWWKRNSGNSEIGSLSFELEGDYFLIYKNNSYIGKIKREYYKLETVESTTYQEDTLSKIQNPYPENSNTAVIFKDGETEIKGEPFSTVVRKCGDYIFVWDSTDVNYVKVYDSEGELYDSIYVSTKGGEGYITYVDFFYTSGGWSFSHTFDSSYLSPTVSLTIPAGCVYITAYSGANHNGYCYDIANKTTSNPVTRPTGGWSYVENSYSEYDYGARGWVYKSIDYGNQYCYCDFLVVNGVIYNYIYNWFSGYSTSEFKVYKQGGEIYSSTSTWQNKSPQIRISDKDTDSYPCTANLIVYSDYYDSVVYTEQITSTHTYQIFNYSKKFGKWAVNFENNKAINIAHNYKKLFEIEGNEDSNHYLTDIDGYNDTYIYFHYGSTYYRISIAETENIWDITTNLNNIYFLFNTTSYLNAFYNAGNDWFCSCDDWNDRVLYSSKSDFTSLEQTTSRLNNQWQNYSDIVSVSQETAAIIRLLPKIANEVEVYSSSETWDGSSVVYTNNGDVVDTTTWSRGDSLSGFYYATSYKTDPTDIEIAFVDSNYTCPQYEDEQGETQEQNYTIFFPVVVATTSTQSLVQQSTLNYSGFTVDLDEGVIYSIPDDEYSYQLTPCLLDTTYLVYSTSVYILNKVGGYIALTSAALGGMWTLIYLSKTEVDPLQEGDSVFVINGVEYTYRNESNRILDYNGSVVCTTYMLKYLGYSTKYAYFYSEFDRAVYLFSGDNSVSKLVPLEQYSPRLTVYEGVGKVDTLNISSLDVLFVNLTTACLVLFDNQYIILDTGVINYWTIDEDLGVLNVNGILYSIVKDNLSENNVNNNEITALPIEITTQFYGDPDNEKNIINDCVYLTVDNLQNVSFGEVKIQAIGLQNQKIVKAEEKILNLKLEDFNDLSQCLIKYQPKIQECKGFKLKITSDFEIAELKIGTSQGAMNQTTKRI